MTGLLRFKLVRAAQSPFVTDDWSQAYAASYQPALDICFEIYEDVASGNEIKSVVQAVSRFDRFPMGKIDQTPMWKVSRRHPAFTNTWFSQPILHFVSGKLSLDVTLPC